jgi:hypothetical protein
LGGSRHGQTVGPELPRRRPLELASIHQLVPREDYETIWIPQARALSPWTLIQWTEDPRLRLRRRAEIAQAAGGITRARARGGGGKGGRLEWRLSSCRLWGDSGPLASCWRQERRLKLCRQKAKEVMLEATQRERGRIVTWLRFQNTAAGDITYIYVFFIFFYTCSDLLHNFILLNFKKLGMGQSSISSVSVLKKGVCFGLANIEIILGVLKSCLLLNYN